MDDLKQVVEELLLLWNIAYPILISSLLLHSKSIISMLFLGHLGNTALAGGSLSIGFANITGYSIMKGLAMGMEPICCQAYGAKRWSVLSNTYQKTLCIQFLAVIPISLLWLNMEPILLCFGQDQSITSIAKIYIKYSIPELLAQAHLHPLRAFLRAQNLTKPLIISSTCAMILHLPINYLLVIYFNLGVRGVALASFCYTLNFNIGLLICLILSRDAIKPWSRQAVNKCTQGWKPLLALMLPTVLSVCLEWWWYEIMLLLCGLLDNPQQNVAAMGILVQVTGLLYVFPYTLSMSLSARVGQELGAGEPARAQGMAIMGLLTACFLGLLAFACTVAMRNQWGILYTSEPHILALVAAALPILGMCELGNCPQTAVCGILIGSARPNLGACINFGSFYLIGLPAAVVMAFVFKMGFVGLWFGLLAAEACCVCMMICSLVCTDWRYQALRAKELTQSQIPENSKDDFEANLLT
ncbi:hypothetical protein Tsubulata_029642 [Turnera subulata]|uniref:Protein DETOXIFICATION n=1 Tax=Turnera subulata TaxID=218843 RepID=A0A9Q0FMU5_9ROSI|nr:hypothetical protein Tsubulata_029642 [Turnera subulata]